VPAVASPSVSAPAPRVPEHLVVAARDGDRAAFEALVRATMADTYRAIGRFRGDAQFTTWLYRITANCASTSLGKRSRHRHEPLADDAPLADEHPDTDPVAMATAGALRDRVTDALADLPPRLRAVVVLRDVYDLPHEAIAAELGISVPAAKVRLHRARRRLREQLFPLPGEEAEARAV
jgi:RNA polymerase sigma-70 factor (ECF subfamily)